MKAAIRSTTMKQLMANEAGEWEVKHAVFLFVACLHTPYSLSSRSVDEKLSSTLCRKPVFFFEAQHSGPTCTQVFHFHWAGLVEHLIVKCGSLGRQIAVTSLFWAWGGLAVLQRHSMHQLSSQLKPKTMNRVERYTVKGLHRLRYQNACQSVFLSLSSSDANLVKYQPLRKQLGQVLKPLSVFWKGFITPRSERTLPTHGACNPLIHPCRSYEVCTQWWWYVGKWSWEEAAGNWKL